MMKGAERKNLLGDWAHWALDTDGGRGARVMKGEGAKGGKKKPVAAVE